MYMGQVAKLEDEHRQRGLPSDEGNQQPLLLESISDNGSNRWQCLHVTTVISNQQHKARKDHVQEKQGHQWYWPALLELCGNQEEEKILGCKKDTISDGFLSTSMRENERDGVGIETKIFWPFKT